MTALISLLSFGAENHAIDPTQTGNEFKCARDRIKLDQESPVIYRGKFIRNCDTIDIESELMN